MPFKNTVQNLFIFFSQKFTVSSNKIDAKLTELKKQNLKLSLKLSEYQDLAQENQKLKKALNFKTDKALELIGGEIISFDPSSWRRVVAINIGEKNGLSEGLYAVDEGGWLVGKITLVKKNYSRLVFITDPDFRMPVFVGDSSFGFLQGGLGQIKVLYIESNDSVKKGDKVWFRTPVSAMPIYIGEIRNVKKTSDSLFQDIDVKLYSEDTVFRKIFVIK
ncbi:MAG: rod shape-determining protein MreC [Candidatus Omnitrophica bacterium]|nr:rod shape-determining protein MreC [Candidatus Omnitrophota bacterium]